MTSEPQEQDDLDPGSPRPWWYYPPGRCGSWGYAQGSDEWGRSTAVIGTPLTGHLVIARPHRRAWVTVDNEADMAYVNLAGPSGLLRSKELGHGLIADIDSGTGRVVGVEIHLDWRTTTVFVTPSEVEAAKLTVELNDEDGRPTREAVRLIADARPAEPATGHSAMEPPLTERTLPAEQVRPQDQVLTSRRGWLLVDQINPAATDPTTLLLFHFANGVARFYRRTETVQVRRLERD